MAKKTETKTKKKRGRKPGNPYFKNKDKGIKVELEREYYEDIEITDPNTGEKRIQRVKVQRFKSPFDTGRSVLGSSDSILSRAEKYNDTLNDDDEETSED